eukprot:IDg23203t1
MLSSAFDLKLSTQGTGIVRRLSMEFSERELCDSSKAKTIGTEVIVFLTHHRIQLRIRREFAIDASVSLGDLGCREMPELMALDIVTRETKENGTDGCANTALRAVVDEKNYSLPSKLQFYLRQRQAGARVSAKKPSPSVRVPPYPQPQQNGRTRRRQRYICSQTAQRLPSNMERDIHSLCRLERDGMRAQTVPHTPVPLEHQKGARRCSARSLLHSADNRGDIPISSIVDEQRQCMFLECLFCQQARQIRRKRLVLWYADSVPSQVEQTPCLGLVLSAKKLNTSKEWRVTSIRYDTQEVFYVPVVEAHESRELWTWFTRDCRFSV